MWERIWATTVEEFSDLGNAEDITRIVLRLLVAMTLGGLLGFGVLRQRLLGGAAGQGQAGGQE